MRGALHSTSFHKSTHLIARVLLFIACLTATALGCGWYFGIPNSVRFGYDYERDVARLPPLPSEKPGADDDENRSDEVDDLWNRAEAAEKEGNLKLDRELLRAYLDQTTVDRYISFSPTGRQERRNSAYDRLDALTALDRGSSSSRVQQYLTARHLHDTDDSDESAEKVNSALRQIQTDANLKDNVAYLRGAELYLQEEFEEAARVFGDIARRYPKSEKREAAIFMSALALLKTSRAYTPTSGDEAHLHEREPEKRYAVEIDRPWHDALAGLKKVIGEYPRGRYTNDARGWVAYLLLRKGDRAGALVEYYRLLSDRNDENARIEAAFSLELVRHHASDHEMDRVERQLSNEPEVALVYAYHNLFNYSINPGSEYVDVEDYEEWRTTIERKERTRILAFSQKLMNSYPNLALGAGFALRAAHASLELEDNEGALTFVRRALHGPIKEDERAEALWARGLAEHRLHRFDAARKTLNTLLRDFPKTSVTEGARRTLAMISEDEGDIEGALEQYIALDYRPDIAYFIDVLMTPEQLAHFIEQHPESPKKNEFTYALGVRYLRSNRWDDARAMFAQVRAISDPNLDRYAAYGGCTNQDCYDAKDTSYISWEEEAPPLTIQMVMRDVQTANEMEALERAVGQAAGSEAAAEALYQLASYQYEESSLLFYNAVAWHGLRYFSLGGFASNGYYRAPNESQMLFAYMQEHDTLARALKIYLEVVDRYPHTRAAQDALYTAAVCHERLSDYGPYWRDIYGAGLHAGPRMVTYADVKAAYPNYQLPRGTYGWQPTTRTVNGRPGWAPKPKYVPPPTKMARLKSMAENLVRQTWWFWNKKLRRWVVFIVIVSGVWFTARVAKRNRRLLKPKIARLRIDTPKPTVDSHWTMLFGKGTDDLDFNDKLKLFLRERGIEFWELARDGTTRPILMRNMLWHSALAVLVVSLLWFLHFG